MGDQLKKYLHDVPRWGMDYKSTSGVYQDGGSTKQVPLGCTKMGDQLNKYLQGVPRWGMD